MQTQSECIRSAVMRHSTSRMAISKSWSACTWPKSHRIRVQWCRGKVSCALHRHSGQAWASKHTRWVHSCCKFCRSTFCDEL
jgi:hypothetical protein